MVSVVNVGTSLSFGLGTSFWLNASPKSSVVCFTNNITLANDNAWKRVIHIHHSFYLSMSAENTLQQAGSMILLTISAKSKQRFRFMICAVWWYWKGMWFISSQLDRLLVTTGRSHIQLINAQLLTHVLGSLHHKRNQWAIQTAQCTFQQTWNPQLQPYTCHICRW